MSAREPRPGRPAPGSGGTTRPEGPLLAIDTATAEAVVALGGPDGTLRDAERWSAGHRHGEELLLRVETLLARAGVERGALGGIVVGTGPGAFTGLRVGIATAKGLAHALGIPLAGVSSGVALLASVPDLAPDGTGTAGTAGGAALLLPAGPSDRVLVRPDGSAHHLPAGDEPALPPGTVLIALDLVGRAPAEALAAGERARAGLGAALLALGAARLAAGPDETATVVPEYVTLPRGIAAEQGEVAWSRDPR